MPLRVRTNRRFRRELRRFERDLMQLLTPKRVHEHLAREHGRTVIQAVIGSAAAGIGPNDQPYAPYSESYQRQIDRVGGQKRWLRGLGRRGRKTGMLDEDRFHFEVRPDGRLMLVWTAADAEMAAYAAVHQGAAWGGENDSRGRIPPRPWLHFANTRNERAAIEAYELTFEEMVAEFNAGRTPR